MYNNAAAPGVREPFSLGWFDYDVSANISFPGAYGATDFSNRGEREPRTGRFLYLNGGLQLQFGPLGVAAMLDVLQYDVAGAQGPSSLDLALGRGHLTAGYGLLDGQVVVGGGARIVYARLEGDQEGGAAAVRMLGLGPELGAVIKPNDVPWRIGVTARAGVEAGPIPLGTPRREARPDGSVVTIAGGFVLPDRIVQPWEVEAGVAYQLGPRPLNPAWVNPREQERELEATIAEDRRARLAAARAEVAAMPARTPDDLAIRAQRAQALAREEEMARAIEDALVRDRKERLYAERRARYLNWPREHVLLLASVLVTGPTTSAVALEGFLDQRLELVGRSVSYSPRIAAESEPIANLLRLRGGVYLEPSRFPGGSTRQHFTFGSDLRLFSWNAFGLIRETTFRLSAFLDVAPRYESFGFGIGAWH